MEEAVEIYEARGQKLFLLSDGSVFGIGKGYINGTALSKDSPKLIIENVRYLEVPKETGYPTWTVIKRDGELYALMSYEVSAPGVSGSTGTMVYLDENGTPVRGPSGEFKTYPKNSGCCIS